MAISEETSEDNVDVIPQEPQPLPVDDLIPGDQQDVEPQISLHALTGICAPQTLKLIGYIKHCKAIILIDNGGTHNFIHC
jgi:hypothetical protein